MTKFNAEAINRKLAFYGINKVDFPHSLDTLDIMDRVIESPIREHGLITRVLNLPYEQQDELLTLIENKPQINLDLTANSSLSKEQYNSHKMIADYNYSVQYGHLKDTGKRPVDRLSIKDPTLTANQLNLVLQTTSMSLSPDKLFNNGTPLSETEMRSEYLSQLENNAEVQAKLAEIGLTRNDFTPSERQFLNSLHNEGKFNPEQATVFNNLINNPDFKDPTLREQLIYDEHFEFLMYESVKGIDFNNIDYSEEFADNDLVETQNPIDELKSAFSNVGIDFNSLDPKHQLWMHEIYQYDAIGFDNLINNPDFKDPTLREQLIYDEHFEFLMYESVKGIDFNNIDYSEEFADNDLVETQNPIDELKSAFSNVGIDFNSLDPKHQLWMHEIYQYDAIGFDNLINNPDFKDPTLREQLINDEQYQAAMHEIDKIINSEDISLDSNVVNQNIPETVQENMSEIKTEPSLELPEQTTGFMNKIFSAVSAVKNKLFQTPEQEQLELSNVGNEYETKFKEVKLDDEKSYYQSSDKSVNVHEDNIEVAKLSPKSVELAIAATIAKFGTEIQVNGSDEFKEHVVNALATNDKFKDVKLDNPELQAKLVEARAEHAINSQANTLSAASDDIQKNGYEKFAQDELSYINTDKIHASIFENDDVFFAVAYNTKEGLEHCFEDSNFNLDSLPDDTRKELEESKDNDTIEEYAEKLAKAHDGEMQSLESYIENQNENERE